MLPDPPFSMLLLSDSENHSIQNGKPNPASRQALDFPQIQALTYSYIGIYSSAMARQATTTDAFNAVAEPRRRQILDVLADGERRVNDLVTLVDLPQPQVSKHLKVLREVGLVDVRSEGRERIYRLDASSLKPIHDWVKDYERMWSDRFDALEQVVEELKAKEEGSGDDDK